MKLFLVLFVCLIHIDVRREVIAFTFQRCYRCAKHENVRHDIWQPCDHEPRHTLILAPLFAKKSGRIINTGKAASGFGGAAKEPCACGSGLAYDKCCGLLHRNPQAYAAASADQVVRARYTAYSKRVVDFIIQSTHPENPRFQSDLKHWRDTIASDCYDSFELTKCEILETQYEGEGDGETAIVRFLAHMTQRDSNERTAFIETSTFQRDPTSKAWLYKDGVVATVAE